MANTKLTPDNITSTDALKAFERMNDPARKYMRAHTRAWPEFWEDRTHQIELTEEIKECNTIKKRKTRSKK